MQPLNRAFQCNGGPAVGEGGRNLDKPIHKSSNAWGMAWGGNRLSKSAFGMEVLTSCI